MDFLKIDLPGTPLLFEDLYNSATFVTTGKGRIGNHLVQPYGQEIPLVRTTTPYAIPPQCFGPLHEALLLQLHAAIAKNPSWNLPVMQFNNALIEVYDKAYTKMNFHSDQALDLHPDSWIALYSCYESPDSIAEIAPRKLVVQEKGSAHTFELPLPHHSVVLFSVQTNRHFLHKIIADGEFSTSGKENRWLGITFRTSNTFIRFQGGNPFFADGTPLVLADASQSKDFFVMRGQENRETGFVYPHVPFTISPGDLLKPDCFSQGT